MLLRNIQYAVKIFLKNYCAVSFVLIFLEKKKIERFPISFFTVILFQLFSGWLLYNSFEICKRE